MENTTTYATTGRATDFRTGYPAGATRIVARLLVRVDIDTDGLNVRLRVDGLGGLAREMMTGDVGAAA